MQQPDTNQQNVQLQSERWRIHLQPHMGLQTQLCQVSTQGEWHDIMPNCSETKAALAAANFHMLPYSNRVRDAQFSYAGKNITLANAEHHAIHGALRKRDWHVIEQSSDRVTAEYDTTEHGAVNWPWPIRAEISYQLKEQALISNMSVTNKGDSAMPAGMGWHPYFCRQINGASAQLLLTVDGVYPDTNGDCLPTGAPINLPDFLHFKTEKALDASQRMDHCLSGFQSPAFIAWPNANIKLQLQASENCNHLVLYNPDEPYFAVEPVTNANDGFNLQANGVDAGVVSLQPGETLNAQMQLVLLD